MLKERFKRRMWTAAGAGLLALTGQTQAQVDSDNLEMIRSPRAAGTTQTNSLSHYSLYGVLGSTGELVRYTFSNGQFDVIGRVELNNVGPIDGIEGMAHVPEHLNIYGFWTNPKDNRTNLIYINSKTAKADLVGHDLGPGKVTAATIFGLDNEGDSDGTTAKVSGHININPNNATHNEFTLHKKDGTSITRDDLHAETHVEADGTCWSGQCMYIRVKPKGNGKQATLFANGQTYNIENNQTYEIYAVSPAEPMETRIYNDHVTGNNKAMGHWWLELRSGQVHIREVSTGGIYVLQTIEADEERNIAFEISEGQIVPSEDYALKVTVLGAAIASGAHDMPVTVEFQVGSSVGAPFGDFSDASAGDINDDDNPRRFIADGLIAAGTPVTVTTRSWMSSDASQNKNFSPYMTVNSHQNSPQVLVLKNGDAVPDIAPFMDQAQISDMVRDFVDQKTGTIVLDENQAIFLFELGTTDLTSAAADFNDAVVLVTLASHPSELNEADDDDALAGPASRLVKVDRESGGLEQIMTLDDVYTGLAASEDGAFYATRDQSLYKIDPFEQAVTLVGPTSDADNTGLESAGATFFGFSHAAGRLSQIDVQTGQPMGTSINLGVSDIQSLVFKYDIQFSEAFD